MQVLWVLYGHLECWVLELLRCLDLGFRVFGLGFGGCGGDR